VKRSITTLIILSAVIISLGFVPSLIPNKDFPLQRHFNITYTTSLENLPQDSGSLKVWIPLAHPFKGQQIKNQKIQAPEGYKIIKDPVYGNHILFYETTKIPSTPIQFKVDYSVKRSTKDFESIKQEPQNLALYLQNSRLTQSTELTDKWAQEVLQHKRTNHEKAHAIFDRVINHMSYDKSEPGYGEGNTQRACLLGKGNCTDFHSLFITTARGAGIPARFKIGFTVPKGSSGSISGYHCWAEYYAKNKGWLPIDISETWKHPEFKKHYLDQFDTNKFMLTTGRDIVLPNSATEQPQNIFFYPHVEVDGVEFKDVKTSFQYKNS